MTKEQVINAWIEGKYARTPNGSLSSDSRGNLRSYNLIIGIHTENGFIVGDFTASGEYYSQTTSTHVGNASQVAPVVPVDQFRTAQAELAWL
ncbi:MAG: hypothetical protein VW683_14450 [Betaproteobacteria bacterium]|jgi:hypothetical protein